MYNFEEILEYNNLGDESFSEIAEDTYEMNISYKNTIKLSFISSFISDLTNQGYDVNSSMDDGVVHIKAFKNAMESQYASKYDTQDLEINNAAAYYNIKKWVDKLNKRLQDVEVAVEKMTTGIDYTKRNKDTKAYDRGRYGNESMFYIINPEINVDEVMEIIDFLDVYNVPMKQQDFTRANIHPVSDSDFLKSLGYSDNETYLSFIIPKDEINFDYTQNLKEYRKNLEKVRK